MSDWEKDFDEMVEAFKYLESDWIVDAARTFESDGVFCETIQTVMYGYGSRQEVYQKTVDKLLASGKIVQVGDRFYAPEFAPKQ